MVAKFFSERTDVTLPEKGWPWPWDDSNTSDYAYAFDKGKVLGCCFGYKWFSCFPLREPKDTDSGSKGQEFPNMKDRRNVAFGERSGLVVIGR